MSIDRNGVIDGRIPAFLMEFFEGTNEEPWILAHRRERVVFSRGKMMDLLNRLFAGEMPSLMELRAFTAEWEFHAWKWNGTYRWRLRMDDHGLNNRDVYDEKHVLWGNHWQDAGGDVLLLVEDGRGCTIGFPRGMESASLPLRMLVRNYFEYDTDGLLRFTDARLVSLADREGRVL